MPALVNRRSYTFDATLQFKDAGLVASSAAANVAASPQILDVGTSPIQGVAVVDASAIEVDTGDEKYELIVEGSNSATFAGTAAAVLGQITLGHLTALAAGLNTTTPGRYEIYFVNVQNDVQYRYLRMYTKIAGTIATGINYKAFLAITPDV